LLTSWKVIPQMLDPFSCSCRSTCRRSTEQTWQGSARPCWNGALRQQAEGVLSRRITQMFWRYSFTVNFTRFHLKCIKQ
jgi:hypothetical protein